MQKRNPLVIKWAHTALLAALCYVVFQFLQIKIPLPGGDATSFHAGNAFCVLAALLLGGTYGGLAGAVGMGIGDLLDPVYVVSFPKTFVLKFCIGLITGLVAHRIAHISESHDSKYVFKWSLIASIAGMLFNVIFDPVVGYFYKQYILGQPQEMASILAKWSTLTTSVNAVISVILATALYNVLRPALAKQGLLLPVGKSSAIKKDAAK
ncbi:MAG: ECF transporter S component [Lachnospiraceae bacterium]|nr:ECF transporter S component [Robinsoniella sp.]MDY3765955.1 ECF transporter S component [Lachnospiraceae bacterium]